MGRPARMLGLWLLLAQLASGPAMAASGQAMVRGGPSGRASSGAAGGAVIDRVVAVIDGRVLTLSELKLEAKVTLVERLGTAGLSVPLDDAALRSALWLAIAQRVEVAEAGRLRAYPVTEAEVAARLKDFRGRFTDRARYEAFLTDEDVDERRIAEILARELRASRMLDGRIRLEAQVSDREVQQYYQTHLAVWNRPLADVQAEIRAKLKAARYQELVSQAVAAAREAPGVRLIAPFARAEGR